MEVRNQPNWNRKVRTQVTESALFKGLVMTDHFDAEISCEEYYCEDFAAWEELVAAEESFDAVYDLAVKRELQSNNSVVQ